jgi:very-short-patch-repair endonuclease
MQQDGQLPQASDVSTFDPDAFIRDSIGKLRTRLLDLTSRNPLISFKHGGRSRRHLRIIDELPDLLYSRLANESPMWFKSLGEEPTEPDDEKTIMFRRALESARLEDVDHLQKIKDAGEEPGEKTLNRLDNELRQALRERLGMPARRPAGNLGAADVARSLSLDPSFDLPASPASADAPVPSKHSDSIIQTLLFEEDLDRTLLRMRDQIRLSIDEAGVNPLFCVFGFLEWYEDANSETPLHGPLLLYPLQVERELARGRYRYTVRSTGEPPMVNVALTERLKRDFEIELPPFVEESQTPEQYLALIQKVIERQKAWKVRRWITVGLFSFARIAMYQDLDPARWEAHGGLHKHACLGQILGGGSSQAVGNSTHDIEEQTDSQLAEPNELEIPLIADADSSQARAIADVLGGRNLVIEGPPGTGKSQTITNIIAAALAAGKTVLFLAEKMAALNVVKDRLKEAGLDQFCLELHSTKGSRKEIFGALAGRLNSAPRKYIDTELRNTLSRLESIRNRLDSTAQALSSPAGGLGITVQELFWKCHRVRSETGELPSEMDELSLPGADCLADVDVGRIVLAAEQFERSRAAIVQTHGSVQQHPWYGVARADVNVFQAEDLVRRVHQLSIVAEEAASVLDAAASLTGWRGSAVADLLAIAPAAALPDLQDGAADDVIARLSDPQTLAAMEEFSRNVAEYTFLESRTSAAFADSKAAAACSSDDLRILCSSAEAAGLGPVHATAVGAMADDLARDAERCQASSDLMSQIASRAGWAAEIDRQAQDTLIAAVQLAAQADERLLASRSPSLLSPGASDALVRASETSRTLREKRDRLESLYFIESITDSAELRRHAAALRSAPILPFLSVRWWRAKAAHKRLLKGQGPKGRTKVASDLEDLAGLKEQVAGFSGDGELKALLGSRFSGVDCDFTQVQRVAEWGDRVRLGLKASDEGSLAMRSFLLEQPPERIELLGGAAASPLFSSLSVASKSDQFDPPATVMAQARIAHARSDGARQTKQMIDRLKLKADWDTSQCNGLRDELARMRELGEELDGSKLAASVLGSGFKGHQTATVGLGSSMRYVRGVLQASLPVQVRDWLLRSQASQHLIAIRPIAAEASKAMNAVERAAVDVEAIVPVDYDQWIGRQSPLASNAAELHEHALRAAKEPESLQALIDDARMLKEVREVGLGPLLDLLQSRRVPLADLGKAARRIVYQSIARAAIAISPPLAGFTGEQYEGRRKEFRELDHKLKRLRQTKLASDLARRPIHPGTDRGPKKQWTGRAVVENEVSKQQRHIPTRELLDRAGTAVQQLMPCFMMSPLSIAQFLKPGGPTFDIVVMDEASQLRPQDAIGAIARGSQVVIVGDPKQLPPTNFFMGAEDNSSDEEGETAADEPSILDHAMAVLRPTRRLKWHYRSRHPSLIAFSNNEFYSDDPLILFPSPYYDRPEFGVKCVQVADGKYGGRVNVPEAQRVAAAALEHAINHPERSLGIVALNQPQAELIGLEIDRIAASNEAFETWRRKWEPSLERFFVKNLENVQGDERDVIFISTVYGRDANGNFFQRFGPINSEGGHRRLNVLFTRSKFQTILFTTMDAADIRTDEKSKWGVRALKGYLKFAKDGVLDSARETGRAADSDFELAVAEVLRTQGYEAVPQVGVAGYFLDIGVRHPQRPGDFVLGIECDGAAYHSSKSARDRDRLRQEVLERLKWRIHRIWSLDWYRNPKRETDRLLAALRESIAAAD